MVTSRDERWNIIFFILFICDAQNVNKNFLSFFYFLILCVARFYDFKIFSRYKSLLYFAVLSERDRDPAFI